MKPYKIIIVEDQSITRSFLEQTVKASSNYEIVSSFDDAALAEAYCLRNEVDIIIMDVMMQSGSNGLEVSEKIKKNNPNIKIIIATSMPEFSWIEFAKKIGVEGFWYKEYSEETILEMLDKVSNGEIVYPQKSPTIQFGNITSDELTERELEVLKELTGGYKNTEIAEHLFISVETVKKHIKSMLEKTGLRSRTELAVKARSLGIAIFR